MKYLWQALIILLITSIAEVLHYLLPLPIPASIYGLILLFLGLQTKVIRLESVEKVGELLIEIMPVMFIPAGVGLLVSWTDLAPFLGQIVVITAVVTLIVMIVTGKVSDFMLAKTENNDKEPQ